MSRQNIALPQVRRFLETKRTDLWWLQPVFTLLGLLTFVVYSTWAAFQGENYFLGGFTSQAQGLQGRCFSNRQSVWSR